MKIMGSERYMGFLIISFFISLLSPASADSINGCGGFVEASSSLIKSRKSNDAKLDYSHITVELRTADGFVKDRTQCAPNGYYFIPVYDKGSFVIKINGPEGWSWDPEKVKVVVDDKGCNNNEDINFRFTGFSLSGRVLGAVGGDSCLEKDFGPSGVNVELSYPDGELVTTDVTSSSGTYLFTNLIPGKYKVHASHSNLDIKVQGSAEVDLGFENGKVDDIFVVSGYNIRGFVVAQGNPMLGVSIYLHSDDVQNIDCPQGSGNYVGQREPLCHAVSDAEGIFLFKSIPCGKYELVPFYMGENTVFDISPSFLSVNVGYQHLTIRQKFQVTGFSIKGRVVDGYGLGVDGVQIYVDGLQRSSTDLDGYYKIDQVTANRYTIEAKKEHYTFSSLNDYMVLPNMAAIADISATAFDLCGVVKAVVSSKTFKVALTHGPENVKPQVRQTDRNGKFCFEVPPGEYRLSVMATRPESSSKLLFLPPHVDVTVKGPLMNIQFSQALMNVHGSVTCMNTCGSSVSITLKRAGGQTSVESKSFTINENDNNFRFSDVLPGKYHLQVQHSSKSNIPGDDPWCWERSIVDIDVGLEDVKGIVFRQKGFWISLISTHDVNASLVKPDRTSMDLEIKKGPQRICVDSSETHELKLDNSCVFFGNSSIKLQPSNPSLVYLEGKKFLLRGQMSVKSDGISLPNSVTINVINSEGRTIDSTDAKIAYGTSVEPIATLFEYSVWTTPGDKLTIVPLDPRGDEEKKLLFYPKSQQVSVAYDGCKATVPLFYGRQGIYLQGSVSPPIPGVLVKIVAANDSPIAALKKDDLALETSTKEDGSFVAGPFYDDINYEVHASKPGYHLKRIGPHSFSCQKLGQISVRVLPELDASEPIPPLLLSLSGSDNYRNNTITEPGGTFVFENLFPGTFYLRPLLKEYAFLPAAQAIELGSGDFKDVTCQAKRVAYSAMGFVTMLSGLPKEGVTVEARSESKGFYEEAITDSNGNFRLRGLHPGTSYAIKVAKKDNLDSSRIERAWPEAIMVQVGSEDLNGLEFVVFDHPDDTILSCHVEGISNQDLQSNLIVEIKSTGEGSTIESAFQLPPSNFFQVKSLPRGKHIVQLRSNLQSYGQKFESDAIEVDLETNPQIHVGPLKYRFKEDQQKQDLAPAPVFPLIVGISVIALFISMPRLKDLYQSAMGIPSPGFMTTAKKDLKKPTIRKKTY